MYLIMTTDIYYSGNDLYGIKWNVKEIAYSEDEARAIANKLAYAFGIGGVMIVQKLDLASQ